MCLLVTAVSCLYVFVSYDRCVVSASRGRDESVLINRLARDRSHCLFVPQVRVQEES